MLSPMLTLLWQTIPDDLKEQGEELLERGQELIEQAKADPALLGILIAIGVVTALIFVWGIIKQAFKAAIIGGLLSAGAWYWYFNIR
jgi:hypothetical protein